MLIDFETFSSNLRCVRARIAESCAAAGRKVDEVRLLPVTKNHPVDAARYVFGAGMVSVGENRVQEALGKIEDWESPLRWELIGPLQSNKARKVAEKMDCVQTVDRPKIAIALQRHLVEFEKKLTVLLQINAGKDPAKAGADLEQASQLMETAMNCPNLKINGLMTIAPLSDDPSVARSAFASLRECRDRLELEFGCKLPELSMGMSGDLRQAILEGSTTVRVGTALFGKRSYV